MANARTGDRNSKDHVAVAGRCGRRGDSDVARELMGRRVSFLLEGGHGLMPWEMIGLASKVLQLM